MKNQEIENEKKFLSIFDEIEGLDPKPLKFAFLKNKTIDLVPNNKYKKEFQALFYSKSKEKFVLHKFILTEEAIYKFSAKDTKVCTSHIFLRNPRIKLVEIKRENIFSINYSRYGIKLTGYLGNIMLCFDDRKQCKNVFAELSKFCVQFNISNKFSQGKIIGKGNFAKVSVGFSKDNCEKFAIKAISKEKLRANSKALISAKFEIEVMRCLNHKNIIKLLEVFEGSKNLYLVQEYVEGGELFSYIKAQKKYSEIVARKIMKCLLNGLVHCHSLNIVHRDLKLENLILVDQSDNFEIKIADFGLSTFIYPGTVQKQKCGSPGYVAPEVLSDHGYNEKADIFSAGVILHILLTGVSPFYGKNVKEVMINNIRGEIQFDIPQWNSVSNQGKNLCQMMTIKNPLKRISALEAVENEWFNLEIDEMNELNDALENIMKYKMQTKISLSKMKEEEKILTRTPLMLGRIIIEDESPNSPVFTPRKSNRISTKSVSLLKKTLDKEFQLSVSRRQENSKNGGKEIPQIAKELFKKANISRNKATSSFYQSLYENSSKKEINSNSSGSIDHLSIPFEYTESNVVAKDKDFAEKTNKNIDIISPFRLFEVNKILIFDVSRITKSILEKSSWSSSKNYYEKISQMSKMIKKSSKPCSESLSKVNFK